MNLEAEFRPHNNRFCGCPLGMKDGEVESENVHAKRNSFRIRGDVVSFPKPITRMIRMIITNIIIVLILSEGKEHRLISRAGKLTVGSGRRDPRRGK